ncbi:MAG TPA: DNA translocase FtsK 4TM domain-containing protein, partial [Rhizomicrobium sp.]
MGTSRRAMGVYQPRNRKAAFADAMADARRTMMHALNIVALRGAGAILFAGSLAALIALATYSSADASLNTATGAEPTNLLGGLGATAADILLQTFGMAALAFLAPPAFWGVRALSGKHLKHAILRAFAWPLGTLFVSAGLGIIPGPESLPAKTGGLIGLSVAGLSIHAAHIYGAPWLATALPLLFLVIGVPLAFLATGVHFIRLARNMANVPAFFLWAHERTRSAISELRAERDYDHESDDDSEYELHEDEEEGVYGLSVKPERVAATPSRDDDRKPLRVRRDESAKKPIPLKPAKQPALNLASSEYQLPALGLLNEPVRLHDATALSDDALEENARMLEAVLSDFGVRGRVMAVRPGPVVTLYEFEPAAGVKSSRVISLSDDVARSMSAVAARIATIPGRNVIGIELPNQNRETVFLRELLSSTEFEKARAPLTLALGKTIGGEPVMADLAKMPHLLIAGTTGSGKSVGLNTMILSLLYRMPPELCRMIMIDPKMLELSVYDGIPHLLTPVVTDPRKAVVALKWAVREMEERYRKMSKLGVRGVEAFNERVRKAKDKGEQLKRTVQTGFDRETGKAIYEDEMLELEPMPYIVLVVDEVADLMMISGKEIEGAVQRLAQMARAAGIHLIAATQRPSVDVITGTIKANFPTRISFQVTSKIDSRTILGEMGAEQLLGQGDMLYMAGGGRISRVHGPFVSDEEVEKVVRHLKSQGQPEYLEAVTAEEP